MKHPKLLIAIFLLPGFLPASAQEISLGRDTASRARWTGYVSSQIAGYNVSGIDPRMNPVSAFIYGNVQIAAGKNFSLPLNFVLSTDRRSFRQPFNVAGISPTWRWATLHLGYCNRHFNPFTLAGHTFLGGGLGLYPGKFRFEAIYGRFQRQAPADTVLLVNNHSVYYTPAYDRRGYGAKIGIGSPRNYVDAIFFYAIDRTDASIPEGLPANVETTPAENAVAGISSKFSFGIKWTWTTDAGLSVITQDHRAPSIEVDDDNWALKIARRFLKVNFSTRYAPAGESALKYAGKNFAFQIRYRRVDPGYRSLGAYYFLTDMENLTLAPSWYLWKRKVRVALRGGIQRDNLRDLKRARSLRTIGSANISLQPSPIIGLNAQYANFGYERQHPDAVPSDTVRIRQVNHSASLSPRLTLANRSVVHTVFALLSFQALQNGDSNVPGAQDFQSWFGNLTYALNFRPNGISLTGGLYFQQNELSGFTTGLRGIQAGIGKNWAGRKINTALNFTYHLNRLNDQPNGSTANVHFRFRYQITRQHALHVACYFLKNAPEQAEFSRDFREMRGQVGYDFRF